MPPCVIFEDEHLLVVHKPAGWNTHAPAPFAGEGIYDWLRHREPRWASLAILHRLDKETSGVLIFGKTPLANKSLTEQFTAHTIRKKYLLLTDRAVNQREFTVKTKIARAGDRYASAAHGETAETHFQTLDSKLKTENLTPFEAQPRTGRTHQIRVHAAESGFPILGDTLYGGTPHPRVCLHAAEITFTHPATGEPVTFTAPMDLECGDMSPLCNWETCLPVGKRGHARALQNNAALRTAIIEPEQTNAYRVVHGASDAHPGWFVEKLGDYLLSQSEASLTEGRHEILDSILHPPSPILGIYHKTLTRRIGRTQPADTSPQLISGKPAPEKFLIRENSVSFELSFAEGYSTGLFLDQRDNRRRFLTGHIAADFQFPIANRQLEIGNWKLEILNAFAYTCGFSVCAARTGAHTTSLDLSKKYLEWGKRNFVLNGLDPAAHDFIYGDTFDWLKRFAKKGRLFDAIVLDPPTFSRSKESGVFQAEKDYGKLVAAALPVLKPDGVLLASTNAATLAPEKFLEAIAIAVRGAGRRIVKQHYVPQPPDFPITREEPGYLKTVWLRIG